MQVIVLKSLRKRCDTRRDAFDSEAMCRSRRSLSLYVADQNNISPTCTPSSPDVHKPRKHSFLHTGQTKKEKCGCPTHKVSVCLLSRWKNCLSAPVRTEIGVALTSFGGLFMMLGVILFFDGSLLALGNVSFRTSEYDNHDSSLIIRLERRLLDRFSSSLASHLSLAHTKHSISSLAKKSSAELYASSVVYYSSS